MWLAQFRNYIFNSSCNILILNKIIFPRAEEHESSKGSLCMITQHMKKDPQDFPGGPVGKTPRSQCRGPGFDPWSGN